MSITDLCAELLHSHAKQTNFNSSINKSNDPPERTVKKYNGKTPRARVEGNRNYYDHNILGLTNRIKTNFRDTNGDPIFANAQSFSQQSANCVHFG